MFFTGQLRSISNCNPVYHIQTKSSEKVSKSSVLDWPSRSQSNLTAQGTHLYPNYVTVTRHLFDRRTPLKKSWNIIFTSYMTCSSGAHLKTHLKKWDLRKINLTLKKSLLNRSKAKELWKRWRSIVNTNLDDTFPLSHLGHEGFNILHKDDRMSLVKV